MGTVYLLHFISKRGKDKRGQHAKYQHAGHYVGFTENLPKRLTEHRTGRGANLMRVIANAGLSFLVARTWGGTTEVDEQRVKNRGGAARLCPICTPGTKAGTFEHVSKGSRWEKTKGRKRLELRKVRTRSPKELEISAA